MNATMGSETAPVWLITGASRGIGLALAREALSRGWQVVATARDPGTLKDLVEAYPETCLAVPLDVSNAASIAEAAAAAQAWRGRVDVLVNNAGHGMHGAVEEVSDADVRRLFEVNVFGLLSITRAVLPAMRARRGGHIVNLSSINGVVASPGSGIYAATKFAVEGLSEALRAELEPLGIGITVVEPGPFRTDFNGSSLVVAGGMIRDYDTTAAKRSAQLRASSGKQPGDPVRGAALICDAVASSEPPFHLMLGAKAYQRAFAKIDAFKIELERWRDRGIAADFEESPGYAVD
jgi:NAD(P)-dependent dehydrogenase (short-subunit alcohol dehydrogenase family)